MEAQFLVLKDDVLNRTKEININSLVDKLRTEFVDHYKIKLLNVASGKFDGWYSNRFKGLGKKRGDGMGFKMPSLSDRESVTNRVLEVAQNIFKVPSFSQEDTSYNVDMNINVCECEIGRTGSVCKHPYILWAFSITKESNFLPYLSSAERQTYAKIAIGGSMAIDAYEGIHDRMMAESSIQQRSSTMETIEDEVNDVVEPIKVSSSLGSGINMRRAHIERLTVEECKEELHKTMTVFEKHLDNNSDKLNVLRGFVKFCDRAQKYPVSRLESALHNFGVGTSASLKVNTSSILKRVRKGKIYVQPEAVKRRRVKDGSKKAKIKGMVVKNNPFVKVSSTKRLHKISANVLNNEAVSKKAGRTMTSKTKHLSKIETSSLKKEK